LNATREFEIVPCYFSPDAPMLQGRVLEWTVSRSVVTR
jgi:hypothetical protein